MLRRGRGDGGGKLVRFFVVRFLRGFCEKWAELDGFWWLAGGEKCGKCGFWTGVFPGWVFGGILGNLW